MNSQVTTGIMNTMLKKSVVFTVRINDATSQHRCTKLADEWYMYDNINTHICAIMNTIYDKFVLCARAFYIVFPASYRLFYLLFRSYFTLFSISFLTFLESFDL